MLRILMRIFVLVAVLAGGWLLAEGWLAGKAAEIVAQNPALRLGSAAALRDPTRFGLALSQPGYSADGVEISANEAQLWVSPFAPTTLESALPPEITLRPQSGGTAREVQLSEGRARVKVAPFDSMNLTRAGLSARDLKLDGAALAQALSVDARMQPLASDAPKAARAAYDVALDLTKLAPNALADLRSFPLPAGDLSVRGTARIWLSEAISPNPPPESIALAGVQADQIELHLGDLAAQVAGRVQADESGLAQGKIVIQTANAREILDYLATLGVISPKAIPLTLTMLNGLSKDAAAQAAAASATPALPPMSSGEIRLPISFEGGKTLLGPIALGPAPRFGP